MLNKVTNNKAFWKPIKPFKGTNIDKNTLVTNDKTMSTMQKFFQVALKALSVITVLILLIILLAIW